MLRKIRIEKEMTLRDMADRLGVSMAWLSRAERVGGSNNRLLNAVIREFGDSKEIINELTHAWALSAPSIKIEFHNATDLERLVCVRLAEKHEFLTPERLKKILRILNSEV